MEQRPVHSVLFDGSEAYDYGSPDNLQFYNTSYGDPSTAYSTQATSGYYPTHYSTYHNGSTGGFWSAFGTGGFDEEPPLLEGILLFIYTFLVYLAFFFQDF
jgi:hypothetical protein